MAPVVSRRDAPRMHEQRRRNSGVFQGWAVGGIILLAGATLYATKPPKAVVPEPACQMTIALIDEAGLDASQIRIVIDQVEQIWGAQGVGFSWSHASEAGEDELTVVIQPGGLPKTGRQLAGWRHVLGSIPVSGGQPVPRITVSLGSVRGLLANVVVRGRPLMQRPERLRQELEAQALGRVIAHEIGHYRLHFYGHTVTGLMRAVFSTGGTGRPGGLAFPSRTRPVPSCAGPRHARR